MLYFFVMFSFGRLLVLNFSLVVPATFDPLLHRCICFPSKINDDDNDDDDDNVTYTTGVWSFHKSCKLITEKLLLA